MPIKSKDGTVVSPPKPVVRAATKPDPVAAPKPVAYDPLADEGSDLSKLLKQTEKVHGFPAIRKASLMPDYKRTPWGVFALDIAFLGGLPESRATLGLGWEHSGKTTCGLKFLGQAQKKYPERRPALIDIEGTYDPEWGEVHGIDNERLLLLQPTSGEEACDLMVGLARSKELSAIMVDSLAGLVPMSIKEKSFEDADVGTQAKMIARFCSVLQSSFIEEARRGHHFAVYAVNQYRMKIGVMRGDPRTTPGGVAAQYFSSVTVDFKNKENVGSDEDSRQVIDYNEHSFRIKKNKCGNGPREGEFMMVRNPDHPLGQGFVDDARTVVTWAKAVGAVTGGGSSWRIRNLDQKFGRLQEIADYFYSDLDFFDKTKIELIEDFREKQGKPRVFL